MGNNDRFNEKQKAAISHDAGPCLVLAGPGSGKTTVITERAARLVREKVVPPESLLVITFTRAAAEEMRDRFLKLSGTRDTKVAFGTFHSVFYRILRESGGAAGRAEVLREGEKLSILEEIFREHYREAEADSEYIRGLLSDISRAKNMGESLKEGPAERVPVREVEALYEKKKRGSGKIDFDDMLILTKKLLISQPEVLADWQKRFRYIMVDEFQDINRIQYDIVRLLAAPENNLFVVGDDDQSIYAFRGAGPEIMLNFPKDMRGTKQILLDTNYRSRTEIVKASLSLIGHNKSRYKKKLQAHSGEGGAVEARRFRNEAEEGESIARETERLMKHGVRPDHIAVLTRTNQGSAHILSAFTKAKIPFVTRDRTENFYRHFICRPVFAALNWTLGNHTRGNFLRFMNCPLRYIRREDLTSDPVDLGVLEQKYRAAGSRAYMADQVKYLSYQLDLMAMLKTPYAMVNFMRTYMEYDRYALTVAGEKGMEPGDLLAVLDELLAESRPFKSIEEWYTHIAAYTRDLEDAGKKHHSENAVVVSTLHSAKGLQYTAVFIPDINEKVIPHEKSLSAAGVEEERRIFYVGMTRAAERLYLFSTAEKYGKKMEDSRFLKELS